MKCAPDGSWFPAGRRIFDVVSLAVKVVGVAVSECAVMPRSDGGSAVACNSDYVRILRFHSKSGGKGGPPWTPLITVQRDAYCCCRALTNTDLSRDG